MSQFEADIPVDLDLEASLPGAKLEVVPDHKSGDFVLLKNSELLSYLAVDFRHDRMELLENLAAEVRSTGRLASSDPTLVVGPTVCPTTGCSDS